jgi:glycosyltransferase involved in cell wall biosynthesis
MFLSSYRLVKRLHRRYKYDCIDAHYIYPDGFAAVLLGKVLDVPVCVSARGSDITLYPTFRQIRPMIRFTLRHAAGLVSVSSALAEGMLALGASADKMKVIGNGVDTQLFCPVSRQEARQKLGVPPDAQLVISVAGLVESKGHALLLRAVERLALRLPKLCLACIGEGILRGEIESLIRHLQLEQHVRLVGLVPNEELKYWYGAADVSCLASTREGWPNVILESLACGTPVVATRVGGIPQVIDSPKLGMTVLRDINSFTEALETSLTRTWDRDALVAHARSRTWEVVANEVGIFLQAMVERRQSLRRRLHYAEMEH